MLKNNEVRLIKLIKDIKKNTNLIKVEKIGSKYDSFPANQKYKEYTNIDISFFNKIKQYFLRKKTYNIIDYVFTFVYHDDIINT